MKLAPLFPLQWWLLAQTALPVSSAANALGGCFHGVFLKFRFS
jgi:hypothetical protein